MTISTTITEHKEIIYFLWWALILILTGYIIGRAVTTVQRFTIGAINASANYPRWHITVIQAITWIITVGMWIIISITIANRAGLPSSFISSLGALLGAGIGFGCQYIFRDIINGAIHLAEKMFIVGDSIALDAGGTHYEGTVEEISLRHITISTLGSIVHIPQGSIDTVENFSSGPGRINISIPLTPDSDIQQATDTLNRTTTTITQGNWDRANPLLDDDDHNALDAVRTLTCRGVSEVKNGYISLTIMGITDPGKGGAAKRAILKLALTSLNDHNITIAHTATINA